ncbi:MAG: DUF2062 domain-containing protein [Alphaproteobacteria bacterium]|nr:DUF2062 domain-containing protein [Alphaproteobacteria bacterium]
MLTKLRRLTRYRLIVPILRGKHSPEYTARGVFVGLFAAMTPTVGVQMPIVFTIWIVTRTLRPSWDFNVIVGMAWTWVTNIFTLAPIYYVFLVTGRIMLGHWDSLGGYDDFARMLAELLRTDVGWLETMWIYVVGIFEVWGVPMFLGSIPWALLCGWLGYRWSLRLILRFRARRAAREETDPAN